MADPYSELQSQAATYRATIREVTDSLKPFRPPTAPASDLAMSRRAILDSSAPNLLLLQSSLALLVISLLGYVLLPVSIAHALAIVLLSVGIALGIFLMK